MRGELDHVFHIARKKPALQTIIDDIVNCTDEFIDSKVEYQVWIRKHLKNLREMKKAEARMGTMKIPGMANNIELEYEVYQYFGSNFFINSEPLSAEIEYGDLFFICDENYMKIGSSVVNCVGKDRERIKESSKYIDRMLLTEYNKLLQKKLEEKHDYIPSDDVEDGGLSGIMSSVRYF